MNSDTEQNEIAIDETKNVQQLFEMPGNGLERRTQCKSARRRIEDELQERHVCPKLKLITRSRKTEKYRDKDEENKWKIEGALLM